MGIVFGFGVIFGVRAAEAPIVSLIAMLGLLLGTAVATGPKGRSLCFIAALGCLIGVAAALRARDPLPPSLTSSTNSVIVGNITSDPDVWRRGWTVQFNWIDDEGIDRSSTLFMPPVPTVGRGDRIEVVGNVDGMFGEYIFADRLRVVERSGWLERQRQSIRKYLAETIHQYVPGGPGALTLGLMTGDDSALTVAERDSLRMAGLSHLTAVSGWNVTLVTGTVGLLFLRLGLRGWGWTIVQFAALAGFVWIVGLDPPVTRAAIMAVAGLIAVRLGRPAHSATVLVLSAGLMVAVSPESLTSLAFQLSVLATMGLILAGHATRNLEGWRAAILTPLATTAAAGLITAPVLAATIGTLSLFTIPANLLAAPIVPAAGTAGVVVVLLSPVPELATIAGWGAWVLSSPLILLARATSSIPYAYHQFTPLSGPLLAVLYASLAVAIASLMPEGRLAYRAASEWVRREPTGAALTATSACLAFLTATLMV